MPDDEGLTADDFCEDMGKVIDLLAYATGAVISAVALAGGIHLKNTLRNRHYHSQTRNPAA